MTLTAPSTVDPWTAVMSPAPIADATRLMLEMSGNFMQLLVDLQRSPVQACIAWQQSLSDTTQGLWDGWQAQFTGGVPIDA